MPLLVVGQQYSNNYNVMLIGQRVESVNLPQGTSQQPWAPLLIGQRMESANLPAGHLSTTLGTTVDRPASGKCQLGRRAPLNNPGHHC